MVHKYHPQYQKLIARLHTARLNAGLTQTDVAGELGCTQSHISKIERGECCIHVLEVHALSTLYKKPLTYFFK